MTERPILFSAPMVRALLAGTKTQTRRAISTKPTRRPNLFDGSWADDYVLDPGNEDWRQDSLRVKVGDRLYVREHWRTGGQLDHLAPRDIEQQWAEPIAYCADEPPGQILRTGRFRQGMHMPRWASRITLTVTDVRVQRLQEISDADAVAEGTPCYVCGGPMDGTSEADCHCFHRKADATDYRNLWEQINGAGSWEANPWIAAYTFSVEHRNIDQLARAA